MNKFDPSRFSPLLRELGAYKPSWLPRDIIAGLSVAAVQVPTAVAYAQLAGFSPEIGLYSSILPVIVYAFLGTSRQLVVGPDAATCAMVASLIGPLAAGDPAQYAALSAGLSLVAGSLMVVGGLTHMGFIVNFFARPILIGFLNGIAASIIAGQMGKLLGITLHHHDFMPSLIELFQRVRETNLPTLAVGASTLVMLALLKKFAPRAPASLIALALAAGGLALFAGPGTAVALVGNVPAGLPHMGLPQVGYHAGQGLLVGALGLVIVSFTSGMLTCRSFAARGGQTIDANQEMWALGAANIGAGISGGFAVTGADSRTAVNAASGNKTQLSSVFAALATAAVAAFLSAPLGYLPLSALAAVLIFSAVQLIDVASYRELERIDQFELRLSILTTGGVLTMGVLPGVAIAIMLALIVILIRIYKPDDTLLGEVPGLDGYNDVSLSPEAKTVPGVVIWRFEGPLVFFNADYFKSRVRQIVSEADPPPRWFVFSLESISQTDATGVKALEEIHKELEDRGIQLLVARPKSFMRKLRDNTGLGERLPIESVFPTIGAAIFSIAAREEQASGTGKGRSRPTRSFRAFYEMQDLARRHISDEPAGSEQEKEQPDS